MTHTKPATQQQYPPPVNINWTHYWKPEEKQELQPKVHTVLTYFPELHGDTLKIGRTTSRNIQGVHPRDKPRTNQNYIRLRPGTTKKTIAHELSHILTREKFVDILAMSRSPNIIDEPPAYIQLPQKIKDQPRLYADTLHKLAQQAITRFSNQQETIQWYEQQIREHTEPQ